METSWTAPDVLRFVEHYELEPALWNPSVPAYKNRTRVHEAWQRLADKLGNRFSVGELKAKKISLMASYRKLATKVRNSDDDGWRPEWFAFEPMDKFLKNIYESRSEKWLTNQQNDSQYNSSAEDDETMDEEYSKKDKHIKKEPNNILMNDKEPNFSHFLEVHVNEPQSRTDQNHVHFLNSYHPVESTRRSKTSKNNEPVETQTSCDAEECNVFGEFIAKKLLSMDQNLRDLAMLEIHKLMFTLKTTSFLMPGPQEASSQRGDMETSQPSSSHE